MMTSLAVKSPQVVYVCKEIVKTRTMYILNNICK